MVIKEILRFSKIMLLVLVIIGCVGCNNKNNGNKSNNDDRSLDTTNVVEDISDNIGEVFTQEDNKDDLYNSLIDSAGTSLQARIKVPQGYSRVQVEKGSFTDFVRNYPMKEHESKVLLYNGNEKGNQDAHVAVFDLPIEEYDLQQCADSIMRMYAEYYWNSKVYDKISFHFVSGFDAKFSKWMQGYNIKVSGNSVNWVSDSSCNSSYESFKKYMRMVFNYASTLSMDKESKEIEVSDIHVGDIFIKGGSPGHVVMVADVCVNGDGKKAFLLAQGYMPAQQFHVLKNPNSEDGIWYYEDEIEYPFRTPEYSFDEGSLKRLSY